MKNVTDPVFRKLRYEALIFMYSKFTNHHESDVKLTSELGPSMNSVLLRWTPSINICSKLKGQCKTMKYGSDTSLVVGTQPTSPQPQF